MGLFYNAPQPTWGPHWEWDLIITLRGLRSHSRQLTYELEKPESISNIHDEESCYSSWRRPWTDQMCFSASGSNCSLHSKIRKIPANIHGAFRMFSHSFKRQKNKQIQLKILNNSFHMASAVAAVVFQPVGCIVISLMESKDTNELHWWTRIDVMTWTYTSNKLVKFGSKLVSCWEKKLRKISDKKWIISITTASNVLHVISCYNMVCEVSDGLPTDRSPPS